MARSRDPWGYNAHRKEVAARAKAAARAQHWGVFPYTPNTDARGNDVVSDPSRGYVAREANPETGRGTYAPYSHVLAVRIFKVRHAAERLSDTMTFGQGGAYDNGTSPGLHANRARGPKAPLRRDKTNVRRRILYQAKRTGEGGGAPGYPAGTRHACRGCGRLLIVDEATRTSHHEAPACAAYLAATAKAKPIRTKWSPR